MTSSLGNNVESEANLLWSGTGYSGFAVFEASLSELNVTYIDIYGDVLYVYSLKKLDAPEESTDASEDSIDAPPSLESRRNVFYMNYSRHELVMFGVVVSSLVLIVLALTVGGGVLPLPKRRLSQSHHLLPLATPKPFESMEEATTDTRNNIGPLLMPVPARNRHSRNVTFDA